MRTLLLKFKTNSKAQAGIEFAIILPMMCALFFGTVEITQGQLIAKKLDKAVRVATDLPGAFPTIERSGSGGGRDELADALEAAAQVIAPFDPALVRMALSGVHIGADGSNRVIWSGARGGASARGCGSSLPIPANLMPENGKEKFLIYGEGHYSYTPPTAWFITGSIDFSSESYWPARHNQPVRSVPPQC